MYTYNQIHQGPQNWAPKWVPATPGPEGTPIAKTVEFVSPEQKKWGVPAPPFGKFGGGHFRVDFGRLWGSVRAPDGAVLDPSTALLGLLRGPF